MKLTCFGIFLLTNSFIYLIQGNNMTFTPNHPLCTGDTVQMVCIVIIPTDSPYKGVFTSAQISFNGSEPTFPTTLDLLTDVDTSRYLGDFKGLDISIERPGAWLNISYIPSDSSIVFGCHAFLENIQSTEALVTGKMMRPAVPPVQPTPFVTTTTLSPDSCSNTRVDWVPVPTERSIDKYYIHRNGQNIATVYGSSISYIDTDSLYLNTVYEYSVVAASCAGNSTVGSTNTFSIKAYSIVNNSLLLAYDTHTGILRADWYLSTGVSTQQPIILLGYELELNYSYTSVHNTNTIIFSEMSTNTTISTILTKPIIQLEDTPYRIAATIKIVKQCGNSWPLGEVNPTDATTTTTTTITTTTSSTYTVATDKPTIEVSNSATTTTTTTSIIIIITLSYFLFFIFQ